MGEGSHQGPRQRSGVAATQRRRPCPPGLYALAAEYSTIAAWSCIDARNLGQPQRHLNESTTYAGLSQDGPTETRVRVSLSMLAYRRQNGPEALVAAQAAQAFSAARRDPFFDSLGRVRAALAYSALGDGRTAGCMRRGISRIAWFGPDLGFAGSGRDFRTPPPASLSPEPCRST